MKSLMTKHHRAQDSNEPNARVVGHAAAVGTGIADTGASRELYLRELDELLQGRMCANPKFRDDIVSR